MITHRGLAELSRFTLGEFDQQRSDRPPAEPQPAAVRARAAPAPGEPPRRRRRSVRTLLAERVQNRDKQGAFSDLPSTLLTDGMDADDADPLLGVNKAVAVRA